jgi:hypothetical protein
MGECRSLYKLEQHLMRELASMDQLGAIFDATRDLLEENPLVTHELIETLSAGLQELKDSLDIHRTLHYLQAEGSMRRSDRCTCRRVDDGMLAENRFCRCAKGYQEKRHTSLQWI